MKAFGIILIVVGILMMVFTGVNFQKEEKVIDVGPLEVNKKENKHIGWPVYAGGVVALVGIGLVFAGKRK